jgi:shikimate dehydrogenase
VTRLLAVLGLDVSRSLSPRLHNAAARALDLDIAYVNVSCASELDFEHALHAMKTLGALGANVTIPYKKRALEMSATVSTTAKKIGAVNTLAFAEDGTFTGDNTDGPGLLAVLSDMPDARFESVQILGAGGAARAAAWALKERGARAVHITSRSGHPLPLEPIAGATLVVSALPKDAALAETALDRWIDLRARPFILDLAYGDLDSPSPLTRASRARGLHALDGLRMLVEQAARSLAAWTGGEVSPILKAMQSVLGTTLYRDSGED